MNFQQFWKKLFVELKQNKKFKTLKRSKLFDADIIDYQTIIITPNHTKKPRKIKINEFQGMWNIMKNDIRSERYINSKKRYYSFWSSSYISTLIDYVVKGQNMQ